MDKERGLGWSGGDKMTEWSVEIWAQAEEGRKATGRLVAHAGTLLRCLLLGFREPVKAAALPGCSGRNGSGRGWEGRGLRWNSIPEAAPIT